MRSISPYRLIPNRRPDQAFLAPEDWCAKHAIINPIVQFVKTALVDASRPENVERAVHYGFWKGTSAESLGESVRSWYDMMANADTEGSTSRAA